MATRTQNKRVETGRHRAGTHTNAVSAGRFFSLPLVQCGVAISAIAALNVVIVSFQFNIAIALCLYFALVVALAFFANPIVAVGSAIAAALSYDYFSTPPRFQFAMSSPYDVVALVLFIGVSVSITTLASRLRDRTSEVALATAKIAAQTEMMRQAEEFAHLNRIMLMGEMAASIAHEINQPLTGIISNAGTSLRYLGAREPDLIAVRQYLDYIVRDGTRAAELIKGLRRAVRRTPTSKEAVDINELIDVALRFTHRQLEQSGTRLRLQLEHELPAVSADPVQLPQVLMNLILNANEAMDEIEDAKRTIVVASGRDDAGRVFVEVRDCGLGLEPDNEEKIFNPFYTTKPEGMGMGLTICRLIVEGHGGELRAQPNHPTGAVFRFTLPVNERMGSG